MYNEIKKNLIDNFLLNTYRYHCVKNKQALFDYISERMPFPFVVKHTDKDSIMTLNLGNKVKFDINFHWEIKNDGIYRLIDID